MKTEISEQDIKDNWDYLLRWFGQRFIKDTSINELKKVILYKRLIDNVKESKKGDIIYKVNKDKREVETSKGYVVFSLKNKGSLLGSGDIIINEGNGYIAGGLDGRAVLKEDYEQYLKELKSLENSKDFIKVKNTDEKDNINPLIVTDKNCCNLKSNTKVYKGGLL